MRWAVISILGFVTLATAQDRRLIPVFEQADNWTCVSKSAFACQSDECSTFGHDNDPLVSAARNTYQISFSKEILVRPGWSERPIKFDQDGIYTVLKSIRAKDTVFMRILNETGDFVEAMTTSDEWVITTFGTCDPSN